MTLRPMKKAALGAMAGGVVMLTAPQPVQAAEYGPVNNPNNQCSGKWSTFGDSDHDGQFALMDKAGGSDDDYCYIDYLNRYASISGPQSTYRVQIAEDSSINQWQWRSVSADNMMPGDNVYFKVCEERQNDPDICTGWQVASKK